MVQKALKNPVGFFPKVANKIRQFREDAPDYFVVGGNASQLNTSKGNPFIIKTHNLDYDFFIQEEEIDLSQNDTYFHTTTLDSDGEYLINIQLSSNTSWEEENNESSVLTIFINGRTGKLWFC